jgi:hypothetical protein
MLSLRPTMPPESLRGFSTSANSSMRFCRKPMLSTSNTMIKIGYLTSFRLETRSGYICRRSFLQVPIGSSAHFAMDLTASLRLWVAMILISTLTLSWIAPSVQCGPPSAIVSTIIRHLKDCRTTDTNRAQPRLHGT